MATVLKKPVVRVTRGKVRETGKLREVLVILRPPNVIGFRAKGCRKEYQLTAESCYWLAMKAEHTYNKKMKKKMKKRKRKYKVKRRTK